MFEDRKTRFPSEVCPANDPLEGLVVLRRPIDIELSDYIVETVRALAVLAIEANDDDLATRLTVAVSTRKIPTK